MQIKTKLAGTFLVVSICFIVALIVALIELSSQYQACKTLIGEDVASLTGLKELYAQGLQGGQATRNVLLNPSDVKAIENYKKSAQEFSKTYETIQKHYTNTSHAAAIADIGKSWQQDSQLRDQIMQLAVSGQLDAAKQLLTDKETDAWRSLKELLLTQEKTKQTALQQQVVGLGKAFRNALIITISISVASIAAALFASIIISKKIAAPLATVSQAAESIAQGDLSITVPCCSKDEIGSLSRSVNDMAISLRNLIGQITESSASVATAAMQLQANSESIASGSREIEGQTISLGTASEEMAATSADIARNCHQAVFNASKANADARNSVTIVHKTIQGMENIAARVRSSAQTVSCLGQRSEQIGAIVGTIEDIADQTNLLALNAAIEAARAGEQGRGFAVVADEVRALAERTTKATHEISDMIKAIQSETSSAVTIMDAGVYEVEQGMETSRHSEQALQGILCSIDEVTVQIDQIATAAEEQTATTQEIATNIHRVTSAIDDTANASRDNVDAVKKLTALAKELLEHAHGFKTI